MPSCLKLRWLSCEYGMEISPLSLACSCFYKCPSKLTCCPHRGMEVVSRSPQPLPNPQAWLQPLSRLHPVCSPSAQEASLNHSRGLTRSPFLSNTGLAERGSPFACKGSHRQSSAKIPKTRPCTHCLLHGCRTATQSLGRVCGTSDRVGQRLSDQ